MELMSAPTRRRLSRGPFDVCLSRTLVGRLWPAMFQQSIRKTCYPHPDREALTRHGIDVVIDGRRRQESAAGGRPKVCDTTADTRGQALGTRNGTAARDLRCVEMSLVLDCRARVARKAARSLAVTLRTLQKPA